MASRTTGQRTASKTAPSRSAPRADADANTLEDWENGSRAAVGVARWSSDGARSVDRVRPGAQVTITYVDRRRNEAMYRDNRKNPFANGVLRLVSPAEDTPPDEAEQLMASPDVMSEQEIADLLEVNVDTFRARIAEVSSETTLARIYEAARKAEAGPTKVNAAKARLQKFTKAPMPGDSVATGKETAGSELANNDAPVGTEAKKYGDLADMGL